ncbi:hemoglobin subunit alpha-3-like [Aquarana catesbeiana]|uniref:hemoglobin subunit alpha-3-like n=1 Tax=Aquarana catesbeiana TaxID=8400 RepID=UPI003CC9DA7D
MELLRSVFKTWLIQCVLHQLPIITMRLSASEKAAVLSIVGKIGSQGSALGSEALTRLFLSFPQTKIYFTNFDLTPGSADLNTHGGKIINVLAGAANHLDDLAGNLSSLSDLHAYNLMVNPQNFSLLSHVMLVVLATHFPDDFTAEVQAAWEKFLALVSAVLTSKYRDLHPA